MKESKRCANCRNHEKLSFNNGVVWCTERMIFLSGLCPPCKEYEHECLGCYHTCCPRNPEHEMTDYEHSERGCENG